MKSKISLLLVVPMITASIFMQACSDDEKPVKRVLITSHRGTGQFYSLDVTTGTQTPIFTITQGENTLKDLRAFVFHPKQNKYFISEATNSGGDLFSVNVTTKEATLIHDNDGEVEWDAIVNWVVDADDSLLSVGDFNQGENAFVKFGVNGGRGNKNIDIDDICCGFGMLYNAKTGVVTLGNSNNSDNGEVIIEKYLKTGEVQGDPIIITDLIGFPEESEMSTSWLTTKSLAQDTDGTIYAILFNSDEGVTYLAKYDLTGLTVTYIATLGEDNTNQYNLLAFVPANKL